ncbi:MAG: ATP-binding cassette domain-containing protein [Candidatus Korarchaeota archaeon]|nr:ATP-binding cassette domain-containing protein [Thermoproteota archaeon]MCR8488254.1 ATP-binding cassette domain-containing protein [Thermoproteota archaeon]
MLLSIRNAWFRYPRSNWILRGLNLDLDRGFYCLTGCNGSGKTTLLRIIAGMLKLNRGSLTVCGKRVKSYRDVVSKVIYLPSNPSTFLTGPRIVDEFERAKVSEDLIDYFSVRDIMHEQIFKVSEGERRLAALVTALSYKTDVVLLDEITVGLDKENRIRLIELLKNVGRERLILLATNDFRILPFCDEILFLEDGRIKIRSKPELALDELPYLSLNQTVQVYKVLLKLGLDPKFTKDDLIKALAMMLC